MEVFKLAQTANLYPALFPGCTIQILVVLAVTAHVVIIFLRKKFNNFTHSVFSDAHEAVKSFDLDDILNISIENISLEVHIFI